MTTDLPRKPPIELSLLGPQADEFRPTDLNLDRKEGLRITWADAHKSVFPLPFLRKNCPCATCRETHGPAPAPASSGMSLTILPANIDKATQFADARLVGNYAIQITWADGHSTGIYDFRMLRVLDASTAH
jgi:DUF971 family protein